MICEKCGTILPDSAGFCGVCGARIEAPAPAQAAPLQPAFTQPQPPTPPQVQVWQQPPPPARQPVQPPPIQAWQQPSQPPVPQPPVQQPTQSAPVYPGAAAALKKGGKGKIIIPLTAVALVAVIVAVILVWKPFGNPATPANAHESAPVAYSYLDDKVAPVIDYTAEEMIYPARYRNMDALVTLTASSENGDCDVMVSVEVPGFTQKYLQKVHLSENITKMRILPPLLTGKLNLNSEKTAQLVLSVTDADSGNKVYVQDSKNITIASQYDMIWWSEKYGELNSDDILAWLTPESSGVLQVKRDACDYISSMTDGDVASIGGYQLMGFTDQETSTFAQAAAIQGAMSDYEKIRYNKAGFSITSPTVQRVMLPDATIDSKSGVCIETSLVMASALQSAGFHVMLIFPPGHAQVAVEASRNSGNYFLIETTILPMGDNPDAWKGTVRAMTKEQWAGYIDGTGDLSMGQCYVLDCDLANKLGILPMSN